jgi:predicted acyl esterase
MRRIVRGLALRLSTTLLLVAAPALSAARAENPPTSAPTPTEFFITTRDEVKLAANLYRPDGKGPWPVIVTRTPYLKDVRDFGALAAHYTKAGFAFVVQDVRGKGHSEGFYQPFVADIEDGFDTVEGLAKQSWSNGKIGITGTSAGGITSNLAAIANPPHLEAAFVIVAPNETFDTSFMGGVPKDKDTVGWLKRQGVSDEVIARAEAGSIRSVFADRGGPGAALKYVRIPIWNVGGWYDIFNTGTVRNFEFLQNQGAPGARGNQRLTMGPFGHGSLSGGLAYPGEDRRLTTLNDDDIRWFDHWLNGVENGVTDEPPVDFFLMAAAEEGAYSAKNRHVAAANWPIDFRATRYYLTADRGLAKTEPGAKSAKISYRFDPADPVPTIGGANLTFERGPMDQRPIKGRQDYLRFQTPILEADVAVAGPVTVELWGATDGPDTDFDAKLVDVYPDGYEALVLDAPIRTRYRHGRMAGDVEMMTPNAPEKLTIDLWNTALVFEKGHRIALHVTSSNAPRFEVNDNNGEAPGEHLPPRIATNTIYFDHDHPSALILPIVYLSGR